MPEFLREGEAVHDFFNPPYLLIGYNDTTGIDKIENMFSDNCSFRSLNIKSEEHRKVGEHTS